MNLKKLKPQTLALSIILSATLAVVNGCGIAKNTPENVFVRDTVIVTKERKLVDTLVVQNWDTITTIKDNVRVRLVRVNDTIYVDAECPTDTFIVNTVTIKNVKEENPKRGWEFYLGWAVAVLAMLVIIKTVLNKVLE
jgi:hypothetical protein